MVGLMRRYSKPVYQGPQLRQTVEMVEKSEKTQVRRSHPLPQVRRVYRRLSAETITELVQAYRDGAPTTELRQHYDLSQGSIIKILHEHGVAMRRQGLTDHDAARAAKLYRSGATLAQLSKQFDVSYGAVRRALVSAGAVLRPRGGSKPRS
jgi:lambda repressor-like predicted transcriptional regulator